MSARDLARMVQDGLQKLPAEEQRQFFSLMSPLRLEHSSATDSDEGGEARWPDQETRLRAILGEKVLSFNPILEEREASRW